MKPAPVLFPILAIVLFLAGAPAHASSKADNRIEDSARKSYVFQNYLKVATVSGNAGNAAEKDLVAKLVSDVHGVKNVTNRMTVTGSK